MPSDMIEAFKVQTRELFEHKISQARRHGMTDAAIIDFLVGAVVETQAKNYELIVYSNPLILMEPSTCTCSTQNKE